MIGILKIKNFYERLLFFNYFYEVYFHFWKWLFDFTYLGCFKEGKLQWWKTIKMIRAMVIQNNCNAMILTRQDYQNSHVTINKIFWKEIKTQTECARNKNRICKNRMCKKQIYEHVLWQNKQNKKKTWEIVIKQTTWIFWVSGVTIRNKNKISKNRMFKKQIYEHVL